MHIAAIYFIQRQIAAQNRYNRRSYKKQVFTWRTISFLHEHLLFYLGYLQKRVVLKLSSGFRSFGDFIILGDFLFKKRWFSFLLQEKLDMGCHSKLGGFLFENGWYFQS